MDWVKVCRSWEWAWPCRNSSRRILESGQRAGPEQAEHCGWMAQVCSFWGPFLESPGLGVGRAKEGGLGRFGEHKEDPVLLERAKRAAEVLDVECGEQGS